MNTTQLLSLLATNRELIQRNNLHAFEHLQMLKSDYASINDDEVLLNLALNISLAEKHFHSNHAAAIENSLQAIDTNKNSPHQNLVARHYWLIGHCFASQGEYNKAEEYLLLVLKTIVPEEPVSTAIRCDTYVALAMNEEFRCGGKGSAKSVEYLKQAIDLPKDEIFDIRKAACLMGLGNVYINGGNIEESLKNYLEAAEIYERFFDLANMASVYCNIGTCYIEMKELVKAELFVEKSLDLRAKLGSPDHLSTSYYNLAIIHKRTNRLDSAYELALKSREILLQTGNVPYLKQTDGLLETIRQIKASSTITA